MSNLPIGHTEGPELKDLAANGNLELIVPTDLSDYQGGGYCVAQWPVIFAWTGNGYGDVSTYYKRYYEQQLAYLQKRIALAETQKEQAEQGTAAQVAESAASAGSVVPARPQSAGKSSPPVPSRTGAYTFGPVVQASAPPRPMDTPPPDSEGLNCTKAEAAKIQRFLGISRDAGMSDAIKLASSDDPKDREFAADMLADIGTPDAIEYLRTLSHDTNSGVATSGKFALKQVSQGPVTYTVDRESIPANPGTASP
jgi:hypothetical protein